MFNRFVCPFLGEIFEIVFFELMILPRIVFIENSAQYFASYFQRQYKVRVSGKMQLLQKKIEGNSPAQNSVTGQKQLLKEIRRHWLLNEVWNARHYNFLLTLAISLFV